MLLRWTTYTGISGHAAGRQLLTRVYREKTGEDLPEVLISPQGKPYFQDSPLHFSLSHTDTHVFCCLSEENVGIDAEPVCRTLSPAFAQRWLSEEEQRRYATAEKKQDILLRFFVQKESYAKLTGRGWGNYLKNTNFDPFSDRIQIIEGHYVAVMTQEEVRHAL